MKRTVLGVLFFLLPLTFSIHPCFGLPTEDVQVVTDAQYFQVAKRMIQEAKGSVYVMMFEMGYYEDYPNSPSNLLIRELADAKKRGVRVQVILDLRDKDDRTSKDNRRAGKALSEGDVEVIYDPFFKTTHAKMMIIDEKLSLVGSTNWTYHALTNNNEVSVLVRSREVARELIDYFNRVKTTGSKE